jgi:hypothetical protein
LRDDKKDESSDETALSLRRQHDYPWIKDHWEPAGHASESWYNPNNLRTVRAALIAARQTDREELQVFLEDEDREVAVSGPAAALVAAAAGRAAATVATATAAWAAAVAGEDDEAGKCAALVAAAAGSAAATVAAASTAATAAVLAAVAEEDAETKKHMPSAEDAAELAELIRAASFREFGISEELLADGWALIAAEAETESEEDQEAEEDEAEDDEDNEEAEAEAALQESLDEKADWMSPTTHRGNIVDNSSKKDINTAQGPGSPMETFWQQFDPKDAQKLAKQRSALMASGEEQSCSDEEAPSETGCVAANNGEAHSKVKGGGTCYSGGSTVSKAMLLLLTIVTVASPTETATSSTSNPFHPPTHPVGQWRQLGVSSWGAGCREQKYDEVPTAAKYDQQARTRVRDPRSLLFGRHRLYDGACVHGSCVHGARKRKPPVYGRGQTPKRTLPNGPARRRKRKRWPRSPRLARRATGSSTATIVYMWREGLDVGCRVPGRSLTIC